MRVTVLGAGPGGYVAALKAAQLGAEVTVVEAAEVGGVCLNRGCIPTKALAASAELFMKTKELNKFGIDISGEPVPNFGAMMDRKNKIVDTQVKGIKGLFKSWGVRLVEGRGKLVGANKVEVTGKDGVETIETDKVIICTGSRPARIPTFPFDGKNVLSSDDALNMDGIPQSMIIVGAGVIGCEFGSIFGALGADITMVEMMDRAVATEDVEVSDLLEREFKKRKIKLTHKKTKIEKVEVREDGVHAFTSEGLELTAQKMLVSIGRSLNVENIGLEETGIEKGKRGEILVNDKMETNVAGVYAVGDVTGKMLLAHVASKQGIIAAVNACGGNQTMDYSAVPAAVFTVPEIASVGLREFQAEAKGIKVKAGRFQYRALGKAHAIGEIAGFIKILADPETDRVLGAHIVGAHASDMIHEMAVALRHGLTVRQVADTIHTHPTLSEGVMEACEAVHGEAIHSPKEK
ncbi:MAG: dihydrolipoyl dehydrogenase [Nitrospiraceae bacterium]|nr:dihydrolipoyl dehydrogenase [Nitrospiraceae bacterium]